MIYTDSIKVVAVEFSVADRIKKSHYYKFNESHLSVKWIEAA